MRHTLIALHLLLVGCAAPAPPAIAPAPQPVEAEPALTVEPPASEEASDPSVEEPPLRERWQSPFAVSSEGRVEPREPRSVVVIGADPAIAAGAEEVRKGGSAEQP